MTSEHEIEQILNQFVVADNHRESDYFAAMRKLVAGRGRAAAAGERAVVEGHRGLQDGMKVAEGGAEAAPAEAAPEIQAAESAE